jgi:predicted DNA-binding ribbon-helix-helix protein
MPGKRVQLDDETWLALDILARDRMMSFQELADEAFRDLLEKHHRPTNLKSALKQSAGMHVRDMPTQSKRIKAGS